MDTGYLLDIYETQIKLEILHFSALLVSPSPLEKGKKSGFWNLRQLQAAQAEAARNLAFALKL